MPLSVSGGPGAGAAGRQAVSAAESEVPLSVGGGGSPEGQGLGRPADRLWQPPGQLQAHVDRSAD